MKKEFASLTKVIILILLMTSLSLLILACSEVKTSMTENDKIIQTVIQNEKNLVLVQLKNLEVDKYKEEVKEILHPNFSQSYIEKIDNIKNNNGLFALSIEKPIKYQISKVYTGLEDSSKSVFLKLPIDNSYNSLYKMYIFKKEENEWKLFQLREYYVITDGPKKENYKNIINTFTNYENSPIEYEDIMIME
ncbi:hypothetical protein [Lutispora thermophila]|uniref:Lipoprotein n=1 Tax=Lutispora thermophila DSM 19022 TaxID=1122184 RepID=A0A1M6B1R7_9FIRM|nr:hypothetical protein [Lutispora thermophila]SHI42433.1 hypothetical protein SAMN02745176_00218 [Lutispora thermophila DSM 19022]